MIIDYTTLLISFLGAAVTAGLIIVTGPLHWRFTHDVDFDSIQKYHLVPVPRIGGIALLVGLICGGIYHGLAADQELHLAKWAGVAAIPVFLGGILEDLKKGMTARDRLLLAFFSATIAHYELHVGLERIDWEWFDTVVIPAPGVALLLTVLMVGGVSHAANIIDGFNGLLLGVAIMALVAFVFVAQQVGATLLVTYFSIMLGALLGVFVFNFPLGRIFLGDGGAYLIGFFLAILSLILVRNHIAVSPWFPLMLLAYPITETIFSMFRKKVLSGVPAMAPDRLHFHMLVHELIRQRSDEISPKACNALTSIAMWGVFIVGLVPAVIWWQDTNKLVLGLLVYVGLYLISYFQLRKLVLEQ